MEQKRDGLSHKPSLIVCPPTLVGHWPHEIAKFVGNDLLSVVQVRVIDACTLSAALNSVMHSLADCVMRVMTCEYMQLAAIDVFSPESVHTAGTAL